MTGVPYISLMHDTAFSSARHAAAFDALLAPYAVPHMGRRRLIEEPRDERLDFQRDRDRILHTQAFRRLKHKTQVFVAGYGDHYRTRITHTIEVAQVSRDIARTLRLNEDLAEAIALAHDLGHTPFGHAGETALSSCMQPFGKHFEHNEQSLRIVTLLERRVAQMPGLNLCTDVLDGLQKHRTPHDQTATDGMLQLSLEGQVVNLADEIAYTAHDTDDALRAGLLDCDLLSTTRLGSRAVAASEERGIEVRSALVGLLIHDVYDVCRRTIMGQPSLQYDAVRRAPAPLVAFSASMRADADALRALLWEHLYQSSSVRAQAERGQMIVRTLFERYVQAPPEKVLTLKRQLACSLEDAVKDYIAGMTDTYATTEAARFLL